MILAVGQHHGNGKKPIKKIETHRPDFCTLTLACRASQSSESENIYQTLQLDDDSQYFSSSSPFGL